MNHLTALGKYLFAIPLVIIGIIYLLNASSITNEVVLAGHVAWDFISGLVFLLAGIAIMIGRKDTVATFLLGIFLLIYVLLVDLPGVIDTEAKDMLSLFHLLKNMALAGGAFVYSRSASHDRSTRLT
jgi:hypothetical protein